MSKAKAVFCSIIIFLLMDVGVARAEWVEWIADAEVGYAWLNNLNNGYFDEIEQNDSMVNPIVSLGRIHQLGDFTRLAVKADLKAEYYNKFDGLNNTSLGASLALRHKFGFGIFVPWTIVDASVSRLTFKNDIRDSDIYSFGVKIGKWLHERIDVQAGFKYEIRDGKDTIPSAHGGEHANVGASPTVFDHINRIFMLDFNFLLSESTSLGLGYSFQTGDVASTYDSKRMKSIMHRHEEVLDDITFGDNWWVYKRVSDISTISAVLSYAFFNGHSSASIGYQHMICSTEGFDYGASVLRLSINYSM